MFYCLEFLVFCTGPLLDGSEARSVMSRNHSTDKGGVCILSWSAQVPGFNTKFNNVVRYFPGNIASSLAIFDALS
jgi:hypothetical protein